MTGAGAEPAGVARPPDSSGPAKTPDPNDTMKRSLVLLASLPLLSAAPALGQASGFQPGELIYYSQAVPNLPPVDAGLLRIDPASGATSVLLPVWSADSRRDNLAFDPYRERVVFYGSFPDFTDPRRLYLLDGFGNTTILGAEEQSVTGIAPASGGRIYYYQSAFGEVRYFDAQDQEHTLMDVGGTQPFDGGGHLTALLYDATTNSLFAGVSRVGTFGCGAQALHSRIVKLPLSRDGSRLRAPLECVEVPINSTVGSSPVGLVHGPDGKLLLFVATGTNDVEPRMVLVDPVTLDQTPFASNGGVTHSMVGGVWSRTLERAVFADIWNNDLRSFAYGDTGAGTVITPSIPISGSGGGEGVAMIEVSRGEGTIVQPYCEPKVTAAGCVPDVRATGTPSASSASGFLIEATDVPPQRLGIFFYGVSGPAAIPFLGGTKCMRLSPVRTRPSSSSDGAGTCDGILSIDFNAYMNSGANPSLTAGTVVWGQFWFRDPAHPVGGVGLTNAITFTVIP